MNERDLDCLATAVYWEARGESRRGQIAVAQVVLNRVLAPRFANSICGVVNQKVPSCQFQSQCDGSTEKPLNVVVWRRVRAVARAAAHLPDITGGALFFHATSLESPSGSRHKAPRVIGGHIFYVGWR